MDLRRRVLRRFRRPPVTGDADEFADGTGAAEALVFEDGAVTLGIFDAFDAFDAFDTFDTLVAWFAGLFVEDPRPIWFSILSQDNFI